MENQNSADVSKIEDLFGIFFRELTNGYRPGTIVRVVGWTPTSLLPSAKRRTVYVQDVPLIRRESKESCSGKIDDHWLNCHQLTKPILKREEECENFNLKYDNGEWFLTKGESMYFLFDPTTEIHWNDY